MKTEITPLLIVIRLEEYDYAGAAALGFVMLAISFVMLLAINLLQVWGRKRMMVSRCPWPVPLHTRTSRPSWLPARVTPTCVRRWCAGC